jgi:hypothetical protein
MKQLFKKISKKIVRHPILYYVRYILLSRNNPGKSTDTMGCLNDINDLNGIPPLYYEVNSRINFAPGMDEFEKALEIAKFLRNTIAGGPGLGLSSGKTLEKMLAGQGGVCSDFSQIFNVFCFINAIKVKEWGCVDRLYKSRFDHAFNEIYSTRFAKWIALDTHKGIYFNCAENSIPLSTMELFQYLRSDKKLQFTLLSDYAPKNIDRISFVYCKSALPFLISDYKNKVNDDFLNKYDHILPSSVINLMLILLRKNHHFIFVMDNYKIKLLPKSIQNMKLIS